ncbi:hypothetical protein BH10ACT1_BH10ACT1_20690 [soil metagenome]
MSDQPPDPDRRGPMPGWAPPTGLAGPGPGGPAWGAPVPAWGRPPDKKRFGAGALVGAGAGGVLLGAIVAVVGIVIIGLLIGDRADHPALSAHGPISEGARSPKVGDCLSSRPSLADVTSDADVVPCTDRHRSEVIGFGSYPDVSTRPSPHAMDLFASEACALSFRDYVGSNPDTTELDFGAVVPDQESWDGGDRRLWCLVDAQSAGGDGVGSLRR